MNRKGNMYKLVVIFTAVLGFGFFRPVAMDPCLQEVEAIFKNMYSNLPVNGKVTYVNYEIITRLRAQGKTAVEEVKKTDVKMYTGEQNYRFISSDVSVFQDKQYTFTVIHSKKNIYWAESGIAANKDERMKQVKDLQDSLFRSYQKVMCTSDANGIKHIALIPNKKWTDVMQISSVDYYIHSTKKEMIKQVINYTTSKKIKSVEYFFKEVVYDYKKMDLSGSVKSLFLASDVKLKAPYTGYKLIDVRKKKK